MNILIFNMSEYSEWQRKGVTNRNRHVLFGMRKIPHVSEIVSVDFMPFTLKRTIRVWVDSIVRRGSGMVISRSLFDTFYKSSEGIYVFSSIRSLWSEKAFYKALKKALLSIHFVPDVVWSYNPYFVGYIEEFVSKNIFVFDTVDNWAEHENFKNDRMRLEKNYQFINQKAHHIFTVAKDLMRLFKGNDSVTWIPNGVDFDHFTKKTTVNSDVYCRLMEIKNPIVGYVGIIQKRIDFKLVRLCAQKCSELEFVFVGPVWKDAETDFVNDLPNVHFVGAVLYDELPLILKTFSVGMIPHKINAFTASMNPLKLYEYLSAGLPVVTTEIAGLDDFKEVVNIADNSNFSVVVRKAVSDSGNAELHVRQRNIARRYTWDNKIKQMFNIIRHEAH